MYDVKALRQAVSQATAEKRDQLIKLIKQSPWQSPDFSNEAFYYVFSQYMYCVMYFPQALCNLGWRIEDDDARMPIIQNIWDEHGGGNLQNTHRYMYRRFLRELREKLNLSAEPVQAQTVQAVAQRYVQGWKHMIEQRPLVEALGALGPGCEELTPVLYEYFVQFIRSKADVSSDSLYFFIHHQEIDEEHSNQVWRTIHAVNHDGTNALDTVVAGTLEAIELEHCFWRDVITESQQLA